MHYAVPLEALHKARKHPRSWWQPARLNSVKVSRSLRLASPLGLPSDHKALPRDALGVFPTFPPGQHRTCVCSCEIASQPVLPTGTCPSYVRRCFAAVRTAPQRPSISQCLRASAATLTRSSSQRVPLSPANRPLQD